MNYRAYKDGLPIILPLYYLHPEQNEAYTHKNEYYFGDSLLVCPITSKRIGGVGLSKVNVYLPEGIWFDVFENRMYTGGRELDVYRNLKNMPVFAKAGAIIPTTDNIDAKEIQKNPKQLHFHIYLGNNGKCEMYEDDGETNEYKKNAFVKTRIVLNNEDKTSLVIEKPKGDLSLLPKTRDYYFEFKFSKDMIGKVKVKVNGKNVDFNHTYDDELRTNTIELKSVDTTSKVEIVFKEQANRLENNLRRDIFNFLDEAEMPFEKKEDLYKAVFTNRNYEELFRELSKRESRYDFICAIVEILKSDIYDTSYFVKEEK